MKSHNNILSNHILQKKKIATKIAAKIARVNGPLDLACGADKATLKTRPPTALRPFSTSSVPYRNVAYVLVS
jgi:hypothetical protein